MDDFPHLDSEPDRYVLAVEGGGFAGLFAAEFLRRLEADVGHSLADCFDLYAGTSIGGLIALGLSSGRSASVVSNRLRRIGPCVFVNRGWGIRALFGPKHSANFLRRALRLLFRDRTLAQIDPALVVPALNMSSAKTEIFRSGDSPHRNMPLVEAALATSAAPFYLPAHVYDGIAYADGGLVANSPEAVAAIDAVYRHAWEPCRITMLVVGSTSSDPALPAVLNRGPWGLSRWLTKLRIVKLSMSAQVSLSREFAASMLDRILYVDKLLSEEQLRVIALDKADRAAIETLCGLASDAYTQFVRVHPDFAKALRDRANSVRDVRSPSTGGPAPVN